MAAYLYGAVICYLITVASGQVCSFPPNWRDTWLISGFQSILEYQVTSNTITSKGTCQASGGDNRYLLLSQSSDSNDGQTNCYRCLVFTVRHVNLLQFKEAIVCDPPNTDGDFLDSLCGRIHNSNILNTLIRKHSVPVPCPKALHSDLDFSYDRGDGTCTSEDSKIKKCASEKSFHIQMGDCGSYGYSGEEAEVQCLADWKSSLGYWLFVKYGESDYRCMYYDITAKTMGMSTDASCIGISIIYNAPLFIEWQESPTSVQTVEPCSYDTFFTQREWSDLEASSIYRYDLSTNELVVDKLVSGVVTYTETVQRLTCFQKIYTGVEHKQQFVAQVLNKCERGYQCLSFKRKSDTVIELVMGALTSSSANACSARKMSSSLSQKRILVDVNADPVACPLPGIYSVQQQSHACSLTVEMGCSNPSEIELKECDMIKSTMQCLASWSEGNTNKIIISKKNHPKKSNCYSYKINEPNTVLQLDEGCNNQAPNILGSQLYYPPFKLHSVVEQCKNGLTVKSSDKNYQSQTSSDKNTGNRLQQNMVYLLVSAVTLTLITTRLP